MKRMCKTTLEALLLLALTSLRASASDVLEVQPLTDRIIMLHFKDGHVMRHQRGQSRSEAVFATTGEVSARLELASNGKPICDRSLARGAEDDYRKWSRDGGFSAWLTNAPMRAVVGTLDPISGN